MYLGNNNKSILASQRRRAIELGRRWLLADETALKERLVLNIERDPRLQKARPSKLRFTGALPPKASLQSERPLASSLRLKPRHAHSGSFVRRIHLAEQAPSWGFGSRNLWYGSFEDLIIQGPCRPVYSMRGLYKITVSSEWFGRQPKL